VGLWRDRLRDLQHLVVGEVVWMADFRRWWLVRSLEVMRREGVLACLMEEREYLWVELGYPEEVVRRVVDEVC